MNKDYTILSSKKINRAKWDSCIDKNDNGLIYARSVYLDYCAPGWKAIVFGDYDAVFPLCIKRKYGIKFLQSPLFTQQLGLIGEWEITFEKLMNIVFQEVRYGDISFNFLNENISENNFQTKTNYILDLNKSYKQIHKKYKYNLKSDLIKSNKHNLSVEFGETVEATDAYRDFLTDVNKKVSLKDFDRFCELFKEEEFRNHFFVRKVYSSSRKLLAVSLFLIDRKRIYNLMSVTLPKGKPVNAMHFLIDSVLQEFQLTDLIFDFEGSDISGVKNFYEKFSPVNQPYYYYHFNKLPFPLNKIKR